LIRHRTKRPDFELDAMIARNHPTWLKRALKAKVNSPIWNELRDLYHQLQHGKCAYCERRLSDRRIGGHGRPVDHFRPKNEVREWPCPDHLKKHKLGSGCKPAYSALAHNPLNYALTCIECNSSLKKCYFPVAGERNLLDSDPGTLKQELALLIYPIGDVDEDPEDLLRLDGFLIQAAHPKPTHEWLRAEVTMRLFMLGPDDQSRSELVDERCREIDRAFKAFRDDDDLTSFLHDSQVHANCIRCFLRLCRSNPKRAEKIHELAKMRLESHGL